jgi:hypothetical protein
MSSIDEFLDEEIQSLANSFSLSSGVFWDKDDAVGSQARERFKAKLKAKFLEVENEAKVPVIIDNKKVGEISLAQEYRILLGMQIASMKADISKSRETAKRNRRYSTHP